MESPAAGSVYGGGDQDPKRRFACDSCRRGKLKCEWENDIACTRCTQRSLTCVKYVAPQKRREKKPKTYLSSLEARLQRMEAAMRKSTTVMTPVGQPNGELDHKSITDAMSALYIHDDGTSIYLGASSGFTIISEPGLKWIEDRTGNGELRRMLNDTPTNNKELILDGSSWCRLEEKDRVPLPSEDQALEMLNGYFNGSFNTLYPLFDEFQIRGQFAQSYPPDPVTDVIWYATLNLIFAASSIMQGRVMAPKSSSSIASPGPQRPSPPVDFKLSKWWPWFKNGASKFTELQMMDGSLMAVQAMALISFVLQTLPFKYSPLVVATSALRLAQAVGLHRSLPYPRLTNTEYELRKNVFWIAFTVERQILASAGQPSIVHEDDIGIDLPHDGEGGPAAGHLRRMAQIGLIQGKIHSCLYSAKSLTKSRMERLQNAGLLDQELNHWRNQIPPALRPGTAIDRSSPIEVFFMPTLIMHLSYYNALTMIHRAVCQDAHGQMNSIDIKRVLEESPNLNPRVFTSDNICLDAARSMIRLVNACSTSFEANDLNIIRVIGYYPLTSSLTLFANIVRDPLHVRAVEDMETMHSVVSFLTTYFEGGANSSRSIHDLHLDHVIQIFRLIVKIAEDAVNRAHTGSTAQTNSDFQTGLLSSMSGNSSVDSSRIPCADLPAYADPGVSPQSYQTHYTPTGDTVRTPLSFHNESVQESTPLADNLYDCYSQDDAMMEGEVFTPHDGSWFFPMSDPLSNDLYTMFPPNS